MSPLLISFGMGLAITAAAFPYLPGWLSMFGAIVGTSLAFGFAAYLVLSVLVGFAQGVREIMKGEI